MFKFVFWSKQSVYDEALKKSEQQWQQTAAVEGEKKVVASALRALADELDPPQKNHFR